MQIHLKALCVFAVFLTWASGTYAAAPLIAAEFDAPGCALEERLFTDAADGQLDEMELLEAALIAGGIGDIDNLRRYQQKAASLAGELRREVDAIRDPHDRANAVLGFLHRRVFCRGYDLAYTDLRRVLDEGRFNCVTATVLFNYLAGEVGLPCRALEMPGHAMSRVLLDIGRVDIETTCPIWSQGNLTAAQPRSSAGMSIGSATSIDRSKAREVSTVQLIAMIYYNRGVDLLAEKRFAEAATANAKSVRLDPRNATARGNLIATVNNWAIELGNRGEYADAVSLLRRGLAMDADFAPLRQNYVHVHRQWMESLCRRGDIEKARDVARAAVAQMPYSPLLARMETELQRMGGQ